MAEDNLIVKTDTEVENSLKTYDAANMAIEAHQKQYDDLKLKLDKVMEEKYALDTEVINLKKIIEEREEKIRYYEIMNKGEKIFAGNSSDYDSPQTTVSLSEIEL